MSEQSSGGLDHFRSTIHVLIIVLSVAAAVVSVSNGDYVMVMLPILTIPILMSIDPRLRWWLR